MDAHHDVPLIVADAADEAALRELASKHRGTYRASIQRSGSAGLTFEVLDG